MKRLASTVLMGLATLGGAAQTDAGRPRLVVGIVVDQLRTDYIEQLQGYFGERGFRTLLSDGVYMRDVDFRVPGLDAASATAMLVTGAYPSQTGVPSANVYETTGIATLLRPALATGSGTSVTNDSFTPEKLRLTTLSDELAVDASGQAKVWSVAADPQQAVILAGHAGNGAVWINNSTGNWATSSYYGSLPSSLQGRNMRTPLSQRLDTMAWRPDAKLSRVAWLPSRQRQNPFKHTFSRTDRDAYKKFSASALSNREVTDVAIEMLNSLDLGGSSGDPDMLNVAYTLAPYKYVSEGNGRAELTDSYLRLDSQLGRLFDAIDRKVGRGNSVIMLVSTGYFDDAMAADPRYRLPGGEFSTRKARSLLNSYLSAKFGQGEYVTAIRDGQVFFDQRTLSSGRNDSDRVIDEARTFLAQMSGVSDVYTLSDILSPTSADTEALRLAVDPRTSGEILVRFLPGWKVEYDEQVPALTKQSRESSVATPAFIIAPGVAPRKIETPVEAVALAPTLAGTIHIRAPSGARARAIF